MAAAAGRLRRLLVRGKRFALASCAEAACVRSLAAARCARIHRVLCSVSVTREAGRFLRAVRRVQRRVVHSLGEGRREEPHVAAAGLVQRSSVRGQRYRRLRLGDLHADRCSCI